MNFIEYLKTRLNDMSLKEVAELKMEDLREQYNEAMAEKENIKNEDRTHANISITYCPHTRTVIVENGPLTVAELNLSVVGRYNMTTVLESCFFDYLAFIENYDEEVENG